MHHETLTHLCVFCLRCIEAAKRFEKSLGCGLTDSTNSAGAYAFSIEAECSLCVKFQLLTAFRKVCLVLQGGPPDLQHTRSFISLLMGSLVKWRLAVHREQEMLLHHEGKQPYRNFG